MQVFGGAVSTPIWGNGGLQGVLIGITGQAYLLLQTVFQ